MISDSFTFKPPYEMHPVAAFDAESGKEIGIQAGILDQEGKLAHIGLGRQVFEMYEELVQAWGSRPDTYDGPRDANFVAWCQGDYVVTIPPEEQSQ